MAGAKVKISAEFDQSLLDALVDLAKRRGVSANTVLEQAVVNEKFLDDERAKGGKVIIEKPDHTFRKLDFPS